MTMVIHFTYDEIRDLARLAGFEFDEDPEVVKMYSGEDGEPDFINVHLGKFFKFPGENGQVELFQKMAWVDGSDFNEFFPLGEPAMIDPAETEGGEA